MGNMIPDAALLYVRYDVQDNALPCTHCDKLQGAGNNCNNIVLRIT